MVNRRLQNVTGDGLVFTTSTGAQWRYSNFRDRAWTPAVKAANLTRKPSPHWLRHTSGIDWNARPPRSGKAAGGVTDPEGRCCRCYLNPSMRTTP